jgi:hypothetical protein
VLKGGRERTEREKDIYICIQKINEKEERKCGKNNIEITRQLWPENF